MARKTIFKNVPTEEETFNRIDAMAKSMGLKKSIFMKEIVDALWDSASQFVVSGKTVMLVDLRGNQTLFTFTGKSALKSGTFQMPTKTSEETVDEEVKKRVESQIEGEKKHGKK